MTHDDPAYRYGPDRLPPRPVRPHTHTGISHRKFLLWPGTDLELCAACGAGLPPDAESEAIET